MQRPRRHALAVHSPRLLLRLLLLGCTAALHWARHNHLPCCLQVGVELAQEALRTAAAELAACLKLEDEQGGLRGRSWGVAV